MLSFLFNNWFVIAGLAGVAGKMSLDHWTVRQTREDVEDLKEDDEERDKAITKIKEDVAWIRGRMERITWRDNGRQH